MPVKRKCRARAAFAQALAAWSRNYDSYPTPGSALISQYMVMPHTADQGPAKSLAVDIDFFFVVVVVVVVVGGGGGRGDATTSSVFFF